MKIEQFGYGRDNLAYLLHGGQHGLAIDGGAAEEMFRFAAAHNIRLIGIANTHGHGDHTSGNRRLHELTGAPLLDNDLIDKAGGLEIDGSRVQVLRTPGHTADSVCFLAGEILVSGDTLFNGTIGNCFSGDMKAFFASIKKLMALPPSTRIFAGHDYVRDSLAFAAKLEPDNRAVAEFLHRYDPGLVVSTMADEFAMNPFLRFNEPRIIAVLAARGMKRATEFERWESLMWIE